MYHKQSLYMLDTHTNRIHLIIACVFYAVRLSLLIVTNRSTRRQ